MRFRGPEGALSDNWGSPRIAQQIALAFGVAIDKDMVRRILSVHYRPDSGSPGPSWLTFLSRRLTERYAARLFRRFGPTD